MRLQLTGTKLERSGNEDKEIYISIFGKKLYYKVDDHKTLTPTVVDQLFVKNILVPAT